MRRNVQTICRKTNTLGICIPAELRDDFGLKPHDQVDFSVENGRIILTPVHTSVKMNVQAASHAPVKVGESND